MARPNATCPLTSASSRTPGRPRGRTWCSLLNRPAELADLGFDLGDAIVSRIAPYAEGGVPGRDTVGAAVCSKPPPAISASTAVPTASRCAHPPTWWPTSSVRAHSARRWRRSTSGSSPARSSAWSPAGSTCSRRSRHSSAARWLDEPTDATVDPPPGFDCFPSAMAAFSLNLADEATLTMALEVLGVDRDAVPQHLDSPRHRSADPAALGEFPSRA